jgi:hypothetical protein
MGRERKRNRDKKSPFSGTILSPSHLLLSALEVLKINITREEKLGIFE